MPKDIKFVLSDEGKPRVFRMKQLTGHTDLQIQQEFTKYFPSGVSVPDWPKIWVKRFNMSTTEFKEDGVSEISMNEERVAALPPAVYNRLVQEYNAIHMAVADNFLEGSASKQPTS